MSRRSWVRSFVLIAVVLGIGVLLAVLKLSAIKQSAAAAANQQEPMEAVAVAVAQERLHRMTTTSIGTVLAMRSITLRNELPGTVSKVMLTPGKVVDKGTLLVALDVSVEEAELRAQIAQAKLAESTLSRMQHLSENRAASAMDLDSARSERDVAQAQIARTKAIIARKTIRAPFRARIGISDIHTGQYLEQGTLLTTLQGVDDAAHVDFTVPQRVAATLHENENVDVIATDSSTPIEAKIVAIDAHIDTTTRNSMVRAKIENAGDRLTPGSSVRLNVPVGEPITAVAIPVSALRKGPGGDHVFVVEADKQGKPRVHQRNVQVAAMLGDEVLIQSGISSGEKVASSGSFKLRDSMLVAITNPTENTESKK